MIPSFLACDSSQAIAGDCCPHIPCPASHILVLPWVGMLHSLLKLEYPLSAKVHFQHSLQSSKKLSVLSHKNS